MKRYKCSLDEVAKYVPWGVIGLAVFIVAAGLAAGAAKGGDIVIISVIAPGVLLPLLVIAMYLLRTRSILVTDGSVIIDRSVKPVTISLAEIHSIKHIPDMRFAIRAFGNGGLYGYTGKYYKKGLGSMTWFCTQKRNYVMIEKADGEKVVLTPDDPEGLIKEVLNNNPAIIS